MIITIIISTAIIIVIISPAIIIIIITIVMRIYCDFPSFWRSIFFSYSFFRTACLFQMFIFIFTFDQRFSFHSQTRFLFLSCLEKKGGRGEVEVFLLSCFLLLTITLLLLLLSTPNSNLLLKTMWYISESQNSLRKGHHWDSNSSPPSCQSTALPMSGSFIN